MKNKVAVLFGLMVVFAFSKQSMAWCNNFVSESDGYPVLYNSCNVEKEVNMQVNLSNGKDYIVKLRVPPHKKRRMQDHDYANMWRSGINYNIKIIAERNVAANTTEPEITKPDLFLGEPVDGVCAKNLFKVFVVGSNKDIIDIFYDKEYVFRDRLKDGHDLKCWEDVKIGQNVIAVRHGRNRDLIALYGFKDERNYTIGRFRKIDGDNHSVSIVRDNVSVIYGNNKDLITKFCFEIDELRWIRSRGDNRRNPIAPQCDPNLVVESVKPR